MNSEQAVDLPSPAKINLFLHVTSRRTDGYHELQTVFRKLAFADTVELRLRRDDCMRMAEPTPGVEPESDLALRAARLLASEAGPGVPGVDIRVRKRIPAGAGLGGGSSNAAAVLKGLCRLWKLDLAPGRLAAIALRLGADVPFFLDGPDAWGEGRGERLESIPLPRAWYVLVCPGIRESTADAFRDPDLRRDAPPISRRDWLAGKARAENDFESGFYRRNPCAREIRDAMSRHGRVRLTGTGSVMFIEFREISRAREVCTRLASRYNTLVTRSLA